MKRAASPKLSSESAAVATSGLRRLTLKNGLTVFLLERPDGVLGSARLLFSSGSAAVPAGKSGLAELTAQLLRRGTERRSADEIDQLLEGAGTDLGVSVSDDSTRFSIVAEPSAMPKLLGLLAELFLVPLFPKRELKAEAQRTCDALQGSLDDPEWVATRAAYVAAFGKHPYGVPTEGWSAEVAKLGRKDARALCQRYAARGACLVLSGPPGSDAWAQPFHALPAGAPPARIPAPAPLKGRSVLIVDKPDATQAQLRLIGRTLRRDSPKLVPALLGNGVLGDGFSSRLVNEVRVNRGLTYGISSRLGTLEATGVFLVRSFTRLEKVDELLQVVLDEMGKLRDEGPTDEELDRVRTYVRGSYQLATETVEQVSAQVAESFRYKLGDDWVTRYPRLLAETSREAVMDALRTELPIEHHRVVVVGPARKLAKSLRRFGPVEVVKLESVI